MYRDPFFNKMSCEHQRQAVCLAIQKANWERHWTIVANSYVPLLSNVILHKVSQGKTDAYINLRVLFGKQDHRFIVKFLITVWKKMPSFKGFRFRYLNNRNRTLQISWIPSYYQLLPSPTPSQRRVTSPPPPNTPRLGLKESPLKPKRIDVVKNQSDEETTHLLQPFPLSDSLEDFLS